MTELERKVQYRFGYYDEGVTLLTDKTFYGNLKNQDGYADFNTASVFSDDKGNSGMCS